MRVHGGQRLSIAFALGAAALFGIRAPAGKALLAVTDPWLLAGLLYLGSGVSLGAFRLVQRSRFGGGAGEAALGRSDWPWLSAAIVTGGIVAPVLLMFGLSRVAAPEASLLLNLEGVLTALVAWVVFREHVDRRIAAVVHSISRDSLEPALFTPLIASGAKQSSAADNAWIASSLRSLQ